MAAETLEVAIALVVPNVVTPMKAHYLEAFGTHCYLGEEGNGALLIRIRDLPQNVLMVITPPKVAM
jgi:hypothetical protein